MKLSKRPPGDVALENVDETQIDAMLAYFADDAVFKMVGMPTGILDTFS